MCVCVCVRMCACVCVDIDIDIDIDRVICNVYRHTITYHYNFIENAVSDSNNINSGAYRNCHIPKTWTLCKWEYMYFPWFSAIAETPCSDLFSACTFDGFVICFISTFLPAYGIRGKGLGQNVHFTRWYHKTPTSNYASFLRVASFNNKWTKHLISLAVFRILRMRGVTICFRRTIYIYIYIYLYCLFIWHGQSDHLRESSIRYATGVQHRPFPVFKWYTANMQLNTFPIDKSYHNSSIPIPFALTRPYYSVYGNIV